ncbi:MAG: hypothetical protein A2W33_10775 [Chloroflexi bacterium RBG_16_52_11]|nr:MAG: hypothetical protein A2W33_10775 [Chloroflexi bacterium RBG_16_52_11]
MRRLLMLLIIVSILALACQVLTIDLVPNPESPPAAEEVELTPSFVVTDEITVTVTPSPSPTATTLSASPTPSATPTLEPLPALPFPVHLHPDGGLYVGDQVSFEIIAPEGANLNGRTAQVSVSQPDQKLLGTAEFAGFGIAGRTQATLTWAWDTRNLEAGDYPVSVAIEPGGPTWTETISLQPEASLLPPEPDAHWASVESECCLIYYVTGTDAERDLARLVEMADEQAQSTRQQLDADFNEPVKIVFLPRVLGHGGFASQELSISYLERNYAGGDPEIVLHHELVHMLDSQLGGELRPSLLVEGLAVYLTGGHFKLEALIPRAAALLELGWYLPLSQLADGFYSSQHEIGYLEAGALVAYLVDRGGRDAFDLFYRDIHNLENGGGQADAMNAALLEHYGLSLEELDGEFREFLAGQPVNPRWVEDVRQSVGYYDTVRRYQQALDSSAHYLTAWLLDFEAMRERGIVADYLRHPNEPGNQAIEALLVAADKGLKAGNYPEVGRLLGMANAALGAYESTTAYPQANSASNGGVQYRLR